VSVKSTSGATNNSSRPFDASELLGHFGLTALIRMLRVEVKSGGADEAIDFAVCDREAGRC
jgi:hypothetical protein